MTREEAKHWLEIELKTWEDECKSKHPIKEAFSVAIETLEKFNDNTNDIISKSHLIKRLKNAEEEFKTDNMESIDDPFIDGVLNAMYFIRVMIWNEPTKGL